jgi:hypothetical protein
LNLLQLVAAPIFSLVFDRQSVQKSLIAWDLAIAGPKMASTMEIDAIFSSSVDTDAVKLDDHEEAWLKDVESSLRDRYASTVLATQAWGTAEQKFPSGGKISGDKLLDLAAGLNLTPENALRESSKIRRNTEKSQQIKGKTASQNLNSSISSSRGPTPAPPATPTSSPAARSQLNSTLDSPDSEDELDSLASTSMRRRGGAGRELDEEASVIREYIDACARESEAEYASNEGQAGLAGATRPGAVPIRLSGAGALELCAAHMRIGDAGARALASVLPRLVYLQVLVRHTSHKRPKLDAPDRPQLITR